MSELFNAFRKIDTFIFDVDGVFTDSSLLLAENGDMLRKMTTRDGYALKKLVRSGYRVVIITGGNSVGVQKRFESMGVDMYYSGIHDKIGLYESLLKNREIPENDSCLYMGDDMPDLPVIKKVGLGCCPTDAIPEVKKIADYISPYSGGEGCVRDVIEKVLKLNNQWS